MAVAAVGQSFPPIAVLAITVPLLEYGSAPTVVALFAYALLPIIVNTIAGLESIEAGVSEAADGMGARRVNASSRSSFRWLHRSSSPASNGRDHQRRHDHRRLDGRSCDARQSDHRRIESPPSNTAYVLQGAILVGLLAIVLDRAIELAGVVAFSNVVHKQPVRA